MQRILFAALAAGVAATLFAQVEAPQTIRTAVDLVVVPVSVRGPEGKLVYGLERADFTVLEDGKSQQISEFSIDPAPLSVAVVVDTGVGSGALQRFADSTLALSSAIVPGDEAAIYRYGTDVTRVVDFTGDTAAIEKSAGPIQKIAADRPAGNNQAWNPLAARGPRWLRWLFNFQAPNRPLHDALFSAALDLEMRSAERRKIVLIVSDGAATGSSRHSYEDTRARLQQSQIQLYAITVDLGVIEGPLSVLRGYATATGGDVYTGRTQQDMEQAFSTITEQARYQYVLGYISNNETGLLPVVRKIEVRVDRANVDVRNRREYLQFPQPK